MTKKAGSGSISQRYGSPDPDPHQIVMDPQHCWDCRNDNKERDGAADGVPGRAEL